jgi:hypothetical protein
VWLRRVFARLWERIYERLMSRRVDAKVVASRKAAQAAAANSDKQASALVNISILLQPERPLPQLGGLSALAPDLVLYLVEHIRRHQPTMVVELGSGASTVILALALERFCKGATLVTVEEDLTYAPDLDGLAVSLRHAPVTDWYDCSVLDDLRDIDLLVIDGPRQWGKKQLMRYPALPFFYDRLSEHTTVVLDDANRAEEKETIRRWREEFPDLSVSVLDVKKGAAVLSRDSASSKERSRPT